MNNSGATSPFAIYVYLFIAQWIFNLAVGAWLYFSRGDSKNSDAIDEVASDLTKFIRASEAANGEQNERLVALESKIELLPTDNEMSQIRSDVASTKARVEGLVEAMRRVEHQTNIIHEHLLRQV